MVKGSAERGYPGAGEGRRYRCGISTECGEFRDNAGTVADDEAEIMRNSEFPADGVRDLQCGARQHFRSARHFVLAQDSVQVGHNGHGGGISSGPVAGEHDLTHKFARGYDHVLASLHVRESDRAGNQGGPHGGKKFDAGA